MMDLRFIQSKIYLTVTAMSPIRGFRPPSVLVTGEDLNLAEQIFLNGVEATEFFINSPTQLIVRIPPSQLRRPLGGIEVFTSVPVGKPNAVLELQLTKPIRKMSGIERMVQSFILLFYTNPTSDIFNPSSGGGGRALIGATTDETGKSITADLTLAVEKTKTELIRLQSRDRRIPPEERLLRADISSMSFDKQNTMLSASVALLNSLGDGAQLSLGR